MNITETTVEKTLAPNTQTDTQPLAPTTIPEKEPSTFAKKMTLAKEFIAQKWKDFCFVALPWGCTASKARRIANKSCRNKYVSRTSRIKNIVREEILPEIEARATFGHHHVKYPKEDCPTILRYLKMHGFKVELGIESPDGCQMIHINW